MTNRVRETTLQLLRDFEGLSLQAYPDGRGYSIGYGVQTYENGQAVRVSDKITRDRAEQLLLHHATLNGNAVSRSILISLNQNQFDALVSLCYNIGAGAFAGSTLVKVINANPKDFGAIEKEFLRWVNSNGKPLPALVERRRAESLIYGQSTFSKNTNWLAIAAGLLAGYGLYKLSKK
jgi:lysozyme